jgi:hypothetical protein
LHAQCELSRGDGAILQLTGEKLMIGYKLWRDLLCQLRSGAPLNHAAVEAAADPVEDAKPNSFNAQGAHLTERNTAAHRIELLESLNENKDTRGFCVLPGR